MIYSQFCVSFRNLRKDEEKGLKEDEHVEDKEKR